MRCSDEPTDAQKPKSQNPSPAMRTMCMVRAAHSPAPLPMSRAAARVRAIRGGRPLCMARILGGDPCRAGGGAETIVARCCTRESRIHLLQSVLDVLATCVDYNVDLRCKRGELGCDLAFRRKALQALNGMLRVLLGLALDSLCLQHGRRQRGAS